MARGGVLRRWHGGRWRAHAGGGRRLHRAAARDARRTPRCRRRPFAPFLDPPLLGALVSLCPLLLQTFFTSSPRLHPPLSPPILLRPLLPRWTSCLGSTVTGRVTDSVQAPGGKEEQPQEHETDQLPPVLAPECQDVYFAPADGPANSAQHLVAATLPRSPRISKLYDGVHVGSVERAAKRKEVSIPSSSSSGSSKHGSRRSVKGKKKVRDLSEIVDMPIKKMSKPMEVDSVTQLAELCDLNVGDVMAEAATLSNESPQQGSTSGICSVVDG